VLAFALRIHLGLLRHLKFSVLLPRDECVGCFTEGGLDAVLLLQQRLALLRISQFRVDKDYVRAQQRLQQATADRPGSVGPAE